MSPLVLISIHIVLVNFVTGTEYIAAFHRSSGNVGITAAAGNTGGSFTVRFHDPDRNFNYSLRSFSHRQYVITSTELTKSLIENRTISIYADEGVSLYGYYLYGAFSPVPVSSLGKIYILPFCGQSTVVVIANNGVSSDVDVTFRLQTAVTYVGKTYVDGDVMSFHLGPYQTYSMTFSFNVLGTTIKTTENVAVFMGNVYQAYVTSYDQLLPVESHGRSFIVPVDNLTSGYLLHILSAYPENTITFGNGRSIQEPFYQQKIRDDVAAFNTTRPSMVVLCKKETYNSGFMVIPPTSSYKHPNSRIVFYPPVGITYVLKIIALNKDGVNLHQYLHQSVAITWETISGYQVGSCSIPARFSTSITSTTNFTVLAYHPKFLHTGGYNLLTGAGHVLPTEIPGSSRNGSVEGKEYLIALPSSVGSVLITGSAGRKPGAFHIRLPNINKNYTFDLGPLSRHKFAVPATSLSKTGTEHKAFIINTSHDEISIYVHYGYAAFSPLPTSALGTSYVLPSCSSSSVLVLSTIHNNTVISITFRLKKPMTYESKTYYDGDILTLTLHQYGMFTFPFGYDITGTTLESSKPVAVFMGSTYNGYVISYDQMLPVSVHGQEYVVAVDHSTANFQLQVTSAYSDNEITFNNGTLVASQFYHEKLEANSTLYFTTTRPSMTTLCKVYTYQSSLLTIPPVSAYRKRAVSLYPSSGVSYTVKLLASKSEDVKAIRYFDPRMSINWITIGNSSYSVGTCQIPARFSTTFTSEGNFNVLAFSTNYANNGGYKIENISNSSGITPTQIPSINESNIDSGKEYLIALPSSVGSVQLTGTAGMKPGAFQIRLPNINKNYTFDLGPLSRHKFTLPATSLAKAGTEHKAFIINTNHDEISIYAHYGYAAFSPLPTSALGTSYVLPSCSSSSVLVLSTIHNNTVISITFRLKKPMTYESKTYYDGDILTLTLDQYDMLTFPFGFDITGTTLESSKPVAVFMGSTYNGYVISYDQMLPVSVHGQEYVVAVDHSTANFQLQVTSAYSDNKITFNNGTLVASQFYHEKLEANSTLYFTTTRPSMTTLCKVYTYQSSLLTIPPVSAYRKRAVSLYPPSGVSYTVKLLASKSDDVKAMRYFDPRMSITWTTIGNSSYSVGTCQIPARFSTTFTSEGNFSVLAFSTNYANNGGYQIENTSNSSAITPTQVPSVNGSSIESGKKYLIALPSSVGSVLITGSAGRKPGAFQIRLPNINKNYTFDLGPLSRHTFTVPATSLSKTGTERKACIINTNHDEISIYAHYGYAAFSPLPTSALGTSYVLPSCSSSSVLVLSTIHNNTVISITFRLKKPMTYESKTYYDGDILTLTLHQYDMFTFPFGFDITGTTLESSKPVAVFMGSTYNGYVISYDQILPVSVHGQEYVVAVDHSTANFQLQVTSAYSDNEITFNNGTLAATQFYHEKLEANSTLYFTTTRPSMATLCKVYTYQSSLLTIPPVSTYSKRAVSLYPPSGVSYTVKLLASKSEDVKAMQYFDPRMSINWTTIGNTSYSVGTCQIPARFSTTFTSEGIFSVLAFSRNYANNGGFDIDENSKSGLIPTVSPSVSEGQDYLVALPSDVGSVFITGSAGRKPGYFQVLFPSRKKNYTFSLGPFSRHKYTVPKASLTVLGDPSAKAFLISTSHEEISIYAHHGYAAFSPLPVSALGTKYILPFCGQSSVLLIAGTQNTDVHITVRLKRSITFRGNVYHDGDHFTIYFQTHQVFSIDHSYDITGTTVESSKPIAVYIGTSYNGYIISYDQIPPSASLGTEFIVAVDDSAYRYYLRTVSEYIDTELTFNSGATVMGQYHQRKLPVNALVSFNSSRPVLALMCRVASYYSGFTILPDVTSYSTKDVNLYPPSGVNYVMKIITAASALVNVGRYFQPTIPIVWQTVANTEFKVGTCVIPTQYSSSISSDTSFIMLAYSSRYFHNGPYRNVSTDESLVTTGHTTHFSSLQTIETTAATSSSYPRTKGTTNGNLKASTQISEFPFSRTNSPATQEASTQISEFPFSSTNSPATQEASTKRSTIPTPRISIDGTSTISNKEVNTTSNNTAYEASTDSKTDDTTPLMKSTFSIKPDSNFSSTTETCGNAENEDMKASDYTIPMVVGLVIGIVIIILLLVIIQRLYRKKKENSSIPFRMSAGFDLDRGKETLL